MHIRPPSHDLALLLEFRSQATYSAVAQRLGVAHTTVSRKVRELESYFGTPLLERSGDALVLTVDGAKAVTAAERMSSELAALDRGISARDERLAGSVKLTTVDILATRYMPVLSSFALSHPGIEVTLDTDPSLRSLSRRDADVALRLTNRPDDLLSGVLLERLEFFAYDRVDAGKDVELPTLRWLDYGTTNAPRAQTRSKPLPAPKGRVSRASKGIEIVEARIDTGDFGEVRECVFGEILRPVVDEEPIPPGGGRHCERAVSKRRGQAPSRFSDAFWLSHCCSS